MEEQKSCKFAGFEYPHGSSICKTGRCMKCNNGAWEETDETCPC